jgi:peroxiredoxin
MKLTYLSVAAAAVLLSLQDSGGDRVVVAEVGKPAPVFRLNDHEGRVVTIGGESDLWTAIAFYPKAMTGG